MLVEALEAEDALYWETDAEKPPSPKRKQPQAEEELLNNSSVLMVNTAMSVKKHPNRHSKELQTQTEQKPKLALQVTTKWWPPKPPLYPSSRKW